MKLKEAPLPRIPEARARQIFSRMKGRRIAVFGDLILDQYLWGDIERISPEAPVPVVNVKDETFRLGGAANVAKNLKMLGVEPLCVGLVGRDAAGKRFRRLLSGLKIDTSRLVEAGDRPTTLKTRVIARHQQMLRIDREATVQVAGSLERALHQRLSDAIRISSGAIVSDYAKGAVTYGLIRKAVAAARVRKVFLAVDPKEKHFDAYRGVSIITPNHKEAAAAAGVKITDDATLAEAGRRLLKKCGISACLITLGENGMALFEGKRLTRIPTMATEVFDVTGAGDTVISVLTAAAAAGAHPWEAAVIANYAAGVVIREVGTAAASPEEILAAMFR